MDIFKKEFKHLLFNNFFSVDNNLELLKIDNYGIGENLDTDQIILGIYNMINKRVSSEVSISNIETFIKDKHYIITREDVFNLSDISYNTVQSMIEEDIYDEFFIVSKEDISAIAFINKDNTSDVTISVDLNKVWRIV